MTEDKREHYLKCLISADITLEMYAHLAATIINELEISEGDDRHSTIEHSIDLICQRVGLLVDTITKEFDVSEQEFDELMAEANKRMGLLQTSNYSHETH